MQMQATDLISAYRSLLNSLGLTDSDGFLQYVTPQGSEPVTCQGRRLVLPTREVLTTLNNSTQMGFHPLSESILRGDSHVLKLLRNLIVGRLFSSLSLLSTTLLGVAMDTSRHGIVSPEGKSLLRRIPEIAPDCHDQFRKIIEHIAKSDSADNPAKLLSIYIKRTATIDGQAYKRGAIISVPLLKELNSKGDKVFGKTVKTKNKAVLAELFRYILDEEGDEVVSKYSQGSNSNIAPSFHALIHTYAAMAKRINHVANIFKDTIIDIHPSIVINVDWLDLFKDLQIYTGLIPSLDGNEGITGSAAAEPQQQQSQHSATHVTPHTVNVQHSSTTAVPTPNPPVRNDTPAPSSGFVVGKLNDNQVKAAHVNPIQVIGGLPVPTPSVQVNNDPVSSWTEYVNNSSQPTHTSMGMPLTGNNNAGFGQTRVSTGFGGGVSTGFGNANAGVSTGFGQTNHNAYAGRGFQQQQQQQRPTISMPLSDGTTANIQSTPFGQTSTTVNSNSRFGF